MTYREAMQEWTDIDGAMDNLGCSLGFFSGTDWFEVKWVMWTVNPLGEFLYDSVMRLVTLGSLEVRTDVDPDEPEYRWSTYASSDGQIFG